MLNFTHTCRQIINQHSVCEGTEHHISFRQTTKGGGSQFTWTGCSYLYFPLPCLMNPAPSKQPSPVMYLQQLQWNLPVLSLHLMFHEFVLMTSQEQSVFQNDRQRFLICPWIVYPTSPSPPPSESSITNILMNFLQKYKNLQKELLQIILTYRKSISDRATLT